MEMAPLSRRNGGRGGNQHNSTSTTLSVSGLAYADSDLKGLGMFLANSEPVNTSSYLDVHRLHSYVGLPASHGL